MVVGIVQMQKGEPMDDLISRQDAIDALKNRWKKTRNYEGIGDDIAEECELYLKQVPSAQPEIIRCKDCIYQTESWSGIKYCEAHGDHIGKDYDYCSNARRRDNG